METKNAYVEVPQHAWLLSNDFTLPEYKDHQILRFIFVPRQKAAAKPQYLAIRTRSAGSSDYNYVSLRKQKEVFSKEENYAVYQEYHQGLNNNSRILRHYHNWHPDRTDEPDSTRRAFLFNPSEWYANLFQKKKETSVRRLLTITFSSSEDHLKCARFSLGPHLATSGCDTGAEDNDCDRLALNPFTIDVTEARTFDGEAGATFTIQYEGQQSASSHE